MIIPLKKITHKFIIPNFHFLPFFTSTGGSGFVRLKQKVRSFGGVGVKMGSSLDTNDCNSKKRAGSVLPASEEFANEAVEAVKSGEIIAVPTDTLYGFACDACPLHGHVLRIEPVARYGLVPHRLYGQLMRRLYIKWVLSPNRLVFWDEFSCLVSNNMW